MPHYDWANSGSADVYVGGEYGVSNVEVGAILRNGGGIQGKNYVILL